MLVLNSSCNKDEEPVISTTVIPSGPLDQKIDVFISSINIGETYPIRIFIPNLDKPEPNRRNFVTFSNGTINNNT